MLQRWCYYPSEFSSLTPSEQAKCDTGEQKTLGESLPGLNERTRELNTTFDIFKIMY